MPLPIIQSLWIGDRLSTIEALCVSSFIKHGHEFHLYTYDKVDNLPAGTLIKDGNEIIPERELFAYGKNRTYAIFADWFRWTLLRKRGGFWVDMDVVCLKPFQFGEELIFGLEGELVGTSVLGFPPQHALCQFLENACGHPNNFLPYDSARTKRRKIFRKLTNNARGNVKWGEIGGPQGFTKALSHFNLLNRAKPFMYFYPIHFSSWQTIFDDSLSEDLDLFSRSYAIHLWNEMSGRHPDFDKNAVFANESLIEHLKRKHLA